MVFLLKSKRICSGAKSLIIKKLLSNKTKHDVLLYVARLRDVLFFYFKRRFEINRISPRSFKFAIEINGTS